MTSPSNTANTATVLTSASSSNSLLWPELYGFWIHGNGPTYVIYVEPASISETAGIRVGDRIIELDNQDVSNLSAGVIKFMARNSKHSPPPISVQSYLLDADLLPDYNFFNSLNAQMVQQTNMNAYGFTISGDMPIMVENCVENGPAYVSGMRAGDIIVEVNNKPIRYSDALKPLLLSHSSKIFLKYIPVTKDSSRMQLVNTLNNNLNNNNNISNQPINNASTAINQSKLQQNISSNQNNMQQSTTQKPVNPDQQMSTQQILQNIEDFEEMKFQRAQNFYSIVRSKKKIIYLYFFLIH